jgi:hypothetical protein
MQRVHTVKYYNPKETDGIVGFPYIHNGTTYQWLRKKEPLDPIDTHYTCIIYS